MVTLARPVVIAMLAVVVSFILALWTSQSRLSDVEDQVYDVSIARHDGAAELKIRDHGIGIPRDRLPFVFDRFERAAPASKYGGFGVGLFVARSLVEAHGGTIRVESEQGVGSTFIVDLPLPGDGA